MTVVSVALVVGLTVRVPSVARTPLEGVDTRGVLATPRFVRVSVPEVRAPALSVATLDRVALAPSLVVLWPTLGVATVRLPVGSALRVAAVPLGVVLRAVEAEPRGWARGLESAYLRGFSLKLVFR